jgi:hypothetical protein
MGPTPLRHPFFPKFLVRLLHWHDLPIPVTSVSSPTNHAIRRHGYLDASFTLGHLCRTPRRKATRREKQHPLGRLGPRDRKQRTEGCQDSPRVLEPLGQLATLERLCHDETGEVVYQGQLPRMFRREVLEEESGQVRDVRAHIHESVVLGVAEGDVIGEDFVVALGTKDGDNVGGQWGGEEEGEELGDEAHAGVVEEGRECVEAFCRVCLALEIASFSSQKRI